MRRESIGTAMLVAAAAIVGWIGWSGNVLLLPAALVFPMLWSTASSRMAAALVSAGYFLAASRGLPQGVATFYGTILAVAWPVGLLAALTWIGMALMMRISSLSALVAAAASPVIAYAFGRGDVAILCLFLAAIIYWRHRANIVRLMDGSEPKIGGAKA